MLDSHRMLAIRLETGMKLAGDYQLLEPIGSGAFGEVWKAMKLDDRRIVAVKVFGRSLKGSFVDLVHPSIVRVLERRPDADPPFLVMEFIQGESLRDRLARGGALPFEEALDIGMQILDALACAHERGIAHLDLKPENVLLEKGGRVKVVDFDPTFESAVEVARSLDMGRPEGRVRVGTFLYMAPEQISGGGSPASDVYSFGVLLYEMLVGTRPAGSFRYPSEMRGDVPSALDDVLRRCLLPSAEMRFRDARELRETIEASRDIAPGGESAPLQGVVDVRSVRELVAYALSGRSSWRDVSQGLASGALLVWLRRMRRPDLVRAYEESRSNGEDPDERLERMLEATGYHAAPQIEVEPAFVDLGRVSSGKTKFSVRVVKRGRGYATTVVGGHGNLHVAVPRVRMEEVDRDFSECAVEAFCVAESGEVRGSLRIGDREVPVTGRVEDEGPSLDVEPSSVKVAVGDEAPVAFRVFNRGKERRSIRVEAPEWIRIGPVPPVEAGGSVRVEGKVLGGLVRKALPATGRFCHAQGKVVFQSGEVRTAVEVGAASARRLDAGLLAIGLLAGFVPLLGPMMAIGSLLSLALAWGGRGGDFQADLARLGRLRDSLSLLVGALPGSVLITMFFVLHC